MVNKLHLKESTDVNTYKDTMDNLTLVLQSYFNEVAEDLNYIRYHFEDEEGIKDTNFDSITDTQYKDMIAKLQTIRQQAKDIRNTVSEVNRIFTDAIE